MSFFDPKHFPSLLALVFILLWVGHQIANVEPKVYLWSRRIGVAAFVGFGICFSIETGATIPSDFVMVSLQALLATGLSIGLSEIFLPMIVYLIRRALDQRAKLALARERKEEQRKFNERTRLERERRQLKDQNAPKYEPVPAPTKEERLEEAKKKYAAALEFLKTAGLDEMEVQAGRDEAKRIYLAEIDRVMK